MREHPRGANVPWIGDDEGPVLLMQSPKERRFLCLISHNPSSVSSDPGGTDLNLSDCTHSHSARFYSRLQAPILEGAQAQRRAAGRRDAPAPRRTSAMFETFRRRLLKLTPPVDDRQIPIHNEARFRLGKAFPSELRRGQERSLKAIYRISDGSSRRERFPFATKETCLR